MKIYKEDNYYLKLLAGFNFLIFIFFTFFGTSLPFRPDIEEIDEISSSNIINQVVYSLIFFNSLVSIFPKRKNFYSIFMREKFLLIFIFWCTISVLWSDYSFTSFKRLFQIYTIITATSAFFLYYDSTQDIYKYLKIVLYPYLILSIISVAIIPGAFDPSFHTWRALTPHKNVLGQVGVISTIFCYMFYQSEKLLFNKTIALFMLFIAVALTVGSFSSTSIILLFLISGFSLLFKLDLIFKPLGIRHTLSALLLVLVIVLILALVLTQPSVMLMFTNLFGKDTSFSGRTDLWAYMMYEISKHPIVGAGYQGFWVVNNVSLSILYEEFIWLPNQSHNGYIDIWNEVGIIGLILFSLFLINYFYSVIKIEKKHIWKTFMIIAFISNWQESTFFRPGQIISAIVIITYIKLFFELDFQKKFLEKKQKIFT